MSKPNYKHHANNPANQPFNINGRRSEKRGWWVRGNNNAKKGQ